MKIEDRLIKLVLERKAIINKIAQIKHELEQIPVSKHVKLDYAVVKVSDLSAEEQNAIIRFSHKNR